MPGFTSLPASLSKVSKLVGNTNTGLSTSYHDNSVAKAIKHAAIHSGGLLKTLHRDEHDQTIDKMMHVMKAYDPTIEHKIRTHGLTDTQQRNLLIHVSSKMGLGDSQKKATRMFFKAMSDKVGQGADAKKIVATQTKRAWAAESRAEAGANQPPHTLASISEKKQSSTFQTHGDQTVRGAVGSYKSLGSISDKFSQNTGIKNISSGLKGIKPSGGVNPLFRPIVK